MKHDLLSWLKKNTARVSHTHIIAPCIPYLKVLYLSKVSYLSTFPKIVQGFVVLRAHICVSQVTNMSKKVQKCHISPKGKVRKKIWKFLMALAINAFFQKQNCYDGSDLLEGIGSPAQILKWFVVLRLQSSLSAFAHPSHPSLPRASRSWPYNEPSSYLNNIFRMAAFNLKWIIFRICAADFIS